MDVTKAAQNTLTLWAKNGLQGVPEPIQDNNGNTPSHQTFLLMEVWQGKVSGDKAHRWLAYAQGWLVCNLALSLEDCKYANTLA